MALDVLHCLPREVLYNPDGTERADAWDVAEIQAEYRLRRKEEYLRDLEQGSEEQKQRADRWLEVRKRRRKELGLPEE